MSRIDCASITNLCGIGGTLSCPISGMMYGLTVCHIFNQTAVWVHYVPVYSMMVQRHTAVPGLQDHDYVSLLQTPCDMHTSQYTCTLCYLTADV
jgi:hypothetical protein